MPAEPGDLAFADFEASDAPLRDEEGVAIRRYPSLNTEASPEDDDALGASNRGRWMSFPRQG